MVLAEYGDKVSLTTKFGVRYEGRLFNVDPKKFTLCLSSVRCFGTEGRPTQTPVAENKELYDLVTFLVCDIENCTIQNYDKNLMQQLRDHNSLLTSTQLHQENPRYFSVADILAKNSDTKRMEQLAPTIPECAVGSTENWTNEYRQLFDQRQMQLKQSVPPQQRSSAAGSQCTNPINTILRSSPSTDPAKKPAMNAYQQQQPKHQQRNAPNQTQTYQRTRIFGKRKVLGDMREIQPDRVGGYNNISACQQPVHPNLRGQNRHNNDGKDSFEQLAQRHNHERHSRTKNHGGRYNFQSTSRNRGDRRESGPSMRTSNSVDNNSAAQYRSNWRSSSCKMHYDFERANNAFEILESKFSKVEINEGAKSTNAKTTYNAPSRRTNMATKETPEFAEIYNKNGSIYDLYHKHNAKWTDSTQESKTNRATFGAASINNTGHYRKCNYFMFKM